MRTFLIVDDDEAIRESLQGILEDEGYEVIAFAHGHEALDYLRTHRLPHVILTNYLMPGMRGDTLLQHAIAEFANVPQCYVLMAARPPIRMPPDVMAFLAQQQIAYLEKPFELQTLLQIVSACPTE